ncbi:MAG: PAS domain-containing protein [Nannocystaceae bacterium]
MTGSDANEAEALRRENEALRAQVQALLEAADGIAWVKDAEGRFLAVNDAFLGMADRGREAILGRTDLDIWPREQAEAFRADDAVVMRSRALKHVEEPIDEQRGGREVWLSTRKTAIVTGEGAVLGAVGIARDITDERWNAGERERVESELVGAQRRLIDELATPVLRLWKGVLAVPLIGSIDKWRADQLMQAILLAIQAEGAREVILDITGVSAVDTVVAERLLRTVAAARLVGARCSFVGIRADVAQTLVQLEVELGDVQTFSTLEQALLQIVGAARLGKGRGR